MGRLDGRVAKMESRGMAAGRLIVVEGPADLIESSRIGVELDAVLDRDGIESRPADIVVFIRRFFEQSQFKRSAVPNGPKISSGGSLSPRGDWRMPSDASAAAWLAELDARLPPPG